MNSQTDVDRELYEGAMTAEEALQKAFQDSDASRAGLVYLWMREFSDARSRRAPDKSTACLTAVLLMKALSAVAADALDKSEKDDSIRALQTDSKVLRASMDQFYDEYTSMITRCEVANGVTSAKRLLAQRPSEMLR